MLTLTPFGASEATYTYNANNLRAGKTVNRVKTDFTWNGQNLAGESTNGITNTYTYDVTGIHSSVINGIYAAYIKDTHGNVSGKINADGALLTEYKYDSFGNLYTDDTPDPFGYCGEYIDNESGLIYLRNRYYDTADGRFITEDPVKDDLNWYAYCAGDPVNFVDPSGLEYLVVSGSEVNNIVDRRYKYNFIEVFFCLKISFTQK